MVEPRRRLAGPFALGLAFLAFASTSLLIGAGFIGLPSEHGPEQPTYGTLAGELHISGALGGDLNLAGSCDDPELGISNWGGRLTLADGRPAIIELQPSADGVGIAVLPNESKQDQISGVIGLARSPSGQAAGVSGWTASGTINAPGGAVQIRASWSCTP